jgi:hypothetical protein
LCFHFCMKCYVCCKKATIPGWKNKNSGRALKFWISKVQYFGQSNLYLFRFSIFYKYIFMEPFKYRSLYGYGHYNRHIPTNIWLETRLFEMNLKTFGPDLRILAFCFVLVSLGKKERKAKNKNRGKMKDKKFY